MALGVLSACSGGDSPDSSPGGGATYQGVGNFFFEDPHFGGAVTSVRLTAISYGRLVQLFGLAADGRRVLMANDYVIDQAIASSAGNWLLETNGVTGQENYTILRNVEDPAGRADFLAIAEAAANSLAPIQVRDLNQAAVYSMVPRNAAIVLQFDDLLDPGTLTQTTISIVQGDPPLAPTTPALGRVLPSRNFGGRSSNGTFYPTRVVFDPTVSEIEAESSPLQLNVNTLGLAASLQASTANTQLRIPTRTNSTLGITNVVRNLSGSTLSTATNGPVDLVASTRPVTRAFRSGGRPDLVSDPFNGFLRDELTPVVVGSSQIELLDAPVQIPGDDGVNSLRFRLPRVQFQSELCASRPQLGDVIVQSGVFAQVESTGEEPINGLTTDVFVQLLSFPSGWPNPQEWETAGAGVASYEVTYEESQDGARTECFVQILPLPTGYPADPGVGVAPDSTFTVRFSEPMEPTSLTAFDSVTLTRQPFDPNVPLPTSSYVVGVVSQSQDLRNVTFIPQVALSHTQGTAEEYFLRIANAEDDSFPPSDLAGNAVARIPEIRFTLEESAMTQLNGGRVNRFTSIDEEPPVGAEFAGQVLIDPVRQLLRSRPVIRSNVVLDNDQPMFAQHTFIPGGVVTPHSPFGSKLQTLWRYCDCGFGLTDQQDHSIDIEGLSWRPAGASITMDRFDAFEIRLAHCLRLPDEVIDPSTAWPRWNNSGLRRDFTQNQLQTDRPDVPTEIVVHPRERGYTIDAGNLYQSSTGTTLLPFPLNQGESFADNIYFTWRDPRLRRRAPNQQNGGTEPWAWFNARGLPAPPFPGYRPYYPQTQAQSIALPLLMEFRVFPDLGAVGQNGWDFNIATNSSAQPYFRTFSTGGTTLAGTAQFVNPDQSDLGTGGFNPGSTPAGQPTPPQDSVVYHGAIDFVTRISHSPSIWFEASILGEQNFVGRRYNTPTVEPAPDAQPIGTDLRIEYRGAINITYLNDEADWAAGTITTNPLEGGQDNDGDPQNDDPTPGIPDFQVDAFKLDLYGDYYNDADNWVDTSQTPPVARQINPWPDHRETNANPGIAFLGGSDAWRFSVEDIRDSRFYQVRLTFVGNPETGLTPEVSAFALTWTQQ